MIAQRDAFLTKLFNKAIEDKNIILLSADMGSPSLNLWKSELKNQFIATGISEQNTINLASGLTHEGKNVFVYMMASWFARCFEQIRYSCAMADLPITILGNGVALGYAPSGPAHQPNEDIALARTLLGMEIYSPTNSLVAENLVDLCLSERKLRYIRLERSYSRKLDNYNVLNNNLNILENHKKSTEKKISIISSGHLLGKASELYDIISKSYDVQLIDLVRISPLDKVCLMDKIDKTTHIITMEEQNLQGGFSSALCEMLCDLNLNIKIKRFGLPNFYIFENGTREQLLNRFGFEINYLLKESLEFINNE